MLSGNPDPACLALAAAFIAIPALNWVVAVLLARAWWEVRRLGLPGRRGIADRCVAATALALVLTAVAVVASDHLWGEIGLDDAVVGWGLLLVMAAASIAPVHWLLSLYLQ